VRGRGEPPGRVACSDHAHEPHQRSIPGLAERRLTHRVAQRCRAPRSRRRQSFTALAPRRSCAALSSASACTRMAFSTAISRSSRGRAVHVSSSPCSSRVPESPMFWCGVLPARSRSRSGRSWVQDCPYCVFISTTGPRPERTSYTSCVTGATTWPQQGSGRLRSHATRRGRIVRGRRRSASRFPFSPTGTAKRHASSMSRSSLSACTTSRCDRRSSSATARRSRRRGCSAANCPTSTP
jgi:hypothetical protein